MARSVLERHIIRHRHNGRKNETPHQRYCRATKGIYRHQAESYEKMWKAHQHAGADTKAENSS
jgi:hypothetical protein